MTSATFDPTEPTTTQGWLSLADRLQLERELADLPTLADILERNYDAPCSPSATATLTTAASATSPASTSSTWPTGGTSARATRTPPGWPTSPAAWAPPPRHPAHPGVLARVLFEAEMLDRGVEHTDPSSTGRSTVTTAAGWLHAHLDWIATAGGNPERASSSSPRCTTSCAGSTPRHQPRRARPPATGTIAELSEALDIPAPTIYHWVRIGWLTRSTTPAPSSSSGTRSSRSGTQPVTPIVVHRPTMASDRRR